MKTTRLIKAFDFAEDQRSLVVLGTGTRLNPKTHGLQLKELGNGGYETGVVRECKTQLFRPTTAKSWYGFEPSVVLQKDWDNNVPTLVQYRLGNSTGNAYYWDGAAWSLATLGTHWNTEEDVALHVSTFPVANGIRAILGLSTTDRTMTPQVFGLKIGWRSTIEWLEEIVLRTVVPLLKSGLRPLAEFAVKLTANTDTVVLDGIVTPYNIVGIDSAFDEALDPLHLADIFMTWTPSTRTVKLTRQVLANSIVRIRFTYEPEIAVTTSQDYSEVAKYPAVVLDDISLVNSFVRSANESIVNRGDGTGVELRPPKQGHVDIRLVTITDKLVDHMRLSIEVERLVSSTPKLRSAGLDESWYFTVQEGYVSQLTVGKEELYRGTHRLRLHDVAMYVSGDRDLYAVRRLLLQGSVNVTIEAPPVGD